HRNRAPPISPQAITPRNGMACRRWDKRSRRNSVSGWTSSTWTTRSRQRQATGGGRRGPIAAPPGSVSASAPLPLTAAYCGLLPLQQITDLPQQGDVFWRRRGLGLGRDFLFALHGTPGGVHRLHEAEHDEGQQHEIDEDSEKVAPRKHDGSGGG